MYVMLIQKKRERIALNAKNKWSMNIQSIFKQYKPTY